MTYLKESLWERLFNRLPSSEANDAIRILKQGGSYRDVDFFVLKEAEQSVEQLRGRAKQAIAAYKGWKLEQAVSRYFAVFRQREGAHLKANARAMTSIWLDARKDYRDLTDLLMHSVANDQPASLIQPKGGRHE